jgi:Fe2+ transport system protein FeoA
MRRVRRRGVRGDTGLPLAGARLSELSVGERATIEGCDAGHMLISRLSALGFTPDAPVTMVQNFGYGPVIVSVRDTRIALGRGEAAKIRVTRTGDRE